MTAREQLENLIADYSTENLKSFLRSKTPAFRPMDSSVQLTRSTFSERFAEAKQIGEISYEESRDNLAVFSVKSTYDLNERTGRRDQYDFARKQLNQSTQYDAGIFVFHGESGAFRFSLVSATYEGTSRSYNNYRRSTYFVSADRPNRTFLEQIGEEPFGSLQEIKDAFSLQAVTESFYNEFESKFNSVVESLSTYNESEDQEKIEDFVLLFVIRIIFIGFVQRRGWIDSNESFVTEFLEDYQRKETPKDTFYTDWLEPLFFNALNTPSGSQVDFDSSYKFAETLSQAPYLNGSLFSRRDIDEEDITIPDEAAETMIRFIFSFNFTLHENEPSDEEIALNPKFLGIIFERLINKEFGAIYTPRTEVDYMCRLSLVKWLENKTSDEIRIENLYELVFPEKGVDKDQKRGSFSDREKEKILELLESITVCDPAAGSGAFLVGMLQVIDDVEVWLRDELGETKELSAYERKERIIARSLYGVEVQEWAVWIAQLRLWITLFIDAPEELRDSQEPILPSLDFKVKQGDSLIQKMGDTLFPVTGFPNLRKGLKTRVRELKEEKIDYFYNEDGDAWKIKEKEYSLFKDIISEEIESKKQELVELQQGNVQEQLFETEKEPEQKELEFIEERKEELEREINTLREQKENLREGRPFIWSIEFSEIFAGEGGFDVVIGNPPYQNKEDIEDPQEKISQEEYKELLRKIPEIDFRKDFKGEYISKRSDIFTYFYIRALNLINKQGVQTFICSSSWLDSKYGSWLQKFLLQKTPVHFVIDNHAKRSFAEAEVNTVITLMGRPDGRVGGKRKFKFVAFKKPFDEVVYSERLIRIDKANSKFTDEKVRVVPKAVDELIESGTNEKGKYIGEKWGGKYLHAPDIYFSILEKGKEKFFDLQRRDVAEINEGRATGANKFFFPKKEMVEEYEIEEKFLLNGVMRTRNNGQFILSERDVERRYLNLSNKNADIDDANILKYIKYGEEQFLPSSKTLQGKNIWWYIPYREPAELLAPCGYGKRMFCAFNKAEAITSNSFTEFRFEEGKEGFVFSVWALLNHPVGWLFLEIYGRKSLGGGMLKVDPSEYKHVKFLHLEDMDIGDVAPQREVKNIFKECGIDPEDEEPISEQEPDPLLDRKKLDNIIFDEIGLTEEERKDVYRAVCQLVHNRISKANNV